MVFNEEQKQRYNRHLVLNEVGFAGQQKIARSKILVIGAGGLGSPVLLYLAAAGIGTLGIADDDMVELSNLQRQVIHHTADLGQAKVESARDKINQLNPEVTVQLHPAAVTPENIRELIDGYDFIVDCTDNFAAKFLINDACVLYNKPFSHGGILEFVGQTMTVVPGESACYRCVFDAPPPPEAVPPPGQSGLLGAIPGVIGTLQAVEALKFVIGKGCLLLSRLMVFDGLDMEFRTITVQKRHECPVCGKPRKINELIDYR